jgi:hypothetical protein
MQSRYEEGLCSLCGGSGKKTVPLPYYPLTYIRRFFFLLMQGPKIGRDNRGIPCTGYPARGEHSQLP